MADVAKQIDLFVRDEIRKGITKATLIKAANDAGREAIKVMQERTAAGYDREGNKLPELSDYPGGYITLGKWKIPSYKTVKSNAGLLAKAQSKAKGTITANKAKGAPDHGQLTGQFFTDMFYKIVEISKGKDKLDVTFELDVKPRSAKKVEWLESTIGGTKFFNIYKTVKRYTKKARKIWGLSKRGKWKKIEEDRIIKAFNKRLKLDSQIDIIVN